MKKHIYYIIAVILLIILATSVSTYIFFIKKNLSYGNIIKITYSTSQSTVDSGVDDTVVTDEKKLSDFAQKLSKFDIKPGGDKSNNEDNSGCSGGSTLGIVIEYDSGKTRKIVLSNCGQKIFSYNSTKGDINDFYNYFTNEFN